MGTRSKEIDRYIAAAAPFARPIISRLRVLFHKADPRLEECLKWGHPSFVYKGIVGGFAAFKNHVSWGVWKPSLVNDPHHILDGRGGTMGSGKFASLDDLAPDEQIIALIKQMVAFNERGVKVKKQRTPRPPAKTPADLRGLLKKNPGADEYFSQLSPSHKREYIEWIEEAKRPETRQRRLNQAIELLEERKSLHWKYERSRELSVDVK